MNTELNDRVWRQVQNGLDSDRLLPAADKQKRDLAKKLDRPLEKNGWRIFVSGQAHAILNGKAPGQRNAEIMLVATVTRWHADVVRLMPDREADLEKIVAAGLARPEPLPQRK